MRARDALFSVVTLGADAIEELATSTKIETEVKIMGGLRVNERLRIGWGYGESIESTSK